MDLNQITIPVSDVKASIAFYTQLGLKLIVHTHDAYARFECSPGGSSFSLHQSDQIASGERTVIYFERQDLDEYISILIKKGVKIEKMPADQPWRWRECLLYDPDGHPIKIYNAGEDRLNPPWRLKDLDSN